MIFHLVLFIFTTFSVSQSSSFSIKSNLIMKTESISNLLNYKYLIKKEPYNSFIHRIEDNEISKIYITEKLDAIISENKEQLNTLEDDYSLTVINPFITDNVVDISVKNNVETIFLQDVTSQNSFPGSNILGGFFNFIDTYLIPFIILTFIVNIIRSIVFQNNLNSNQTPPLFGNFGIKNVNSDKINMIKSNISLSSFAGSPEIFEECTEVVSYLKNGTIYQQAGAEIPRGILLEGPPGTGKTLLAKAIASETDANFISIAASEFVELFVGMGATKVRNLFKKARENKPCIIFIDEIDAVGKQRGGNGQFGSNDEREQTLNQILAEMDGFADNTDLLIMAATNRRDTLDAALLRPGRFDRIISVPLPDTKSRSEILKFHSKNKVLSPEINIQLIAELTNGFSGAQLKNLLNEAAIFAGRETRIIISENDILNSIDKLIVGIIKRVDTRDEDSIKRVAIHETGHALLAALYNNYFDLKKVTIKSTYNGAGGFTIFNENNNITESGLYTKDLLFKRLVIALGGKAGENIYYGENFVSMGAIQDLKQANSLARRMVTNYGMGTTLEVFYDETSDDSGRFKTYSELTKEVIDTESMKLINNAYKEAKMLIQDNKELFDDITNKLIKEKTLLGKDILRMIYTF